MKSLTTIFSQISKISLYLAIFLIPLFFLPFGQNVLDYPKQTLLLFLVFLSLISWLVKQISQERIVLRGNKLLYLALFSILILFVLSTIFSLWPTASFWGWPLSITDSFLTFLSFLVLAFLFANVFQNEKELFSGVFLFIVSGAIAGLFVLLQLYGVFILPFDFSQISSFNTIGSVYSAVIFLAVLLPLSLVLASKTKKYKAVFWLIFLILLGEVVLIDFNNAWIVLLLGILTITIFSLANFREKIRIGWLSLLMVILVLSIFFLFFPLRFSGFPVLPLQISPSSVSEFEILKGVFGEGIKNTTLGTGPGTFIFDYSKYHSPLLNLTPFWGTRFSSGSSEFLDWFITKGILGGIALFFFLGLIIYFAIKGLTKREDPFGIKLGFSASVIAIIGAGFLSPFSFSLWLTFWIILGGLLFYNSKEWKVNLNSPSLRIGFSIFILAITIFGLVLLVFQGQKYFAEINYSKGIEFSQRGNIDQAIDYIQRATSLNPSVDIYWRDLAQLYLSKANLISQDQKLEAEQKGQLVHQAIANGVQSLNQSINTSLFNVANWNVRGFFYRSLIGVPGSGEIALESYRKAIELEPASPFAYGEMGRVYILMAQDFKEKQMEEGKQEALSLAVRNLEKAIELKSDYASAHYLLAVAYDQQGKEDEAILRLEETKKTAFQDTGIFFQLGMLYWRKEEWDKAQKEFEETIELSPDYSNARYMLGLVYDKKGEKNKAKEQFEKVAQLNPENQEVKKILENLNKGLPALEGIIPAQPPIGEIPPEIQK